MNYEYPKLCKNCYYTQVFKEYSKLYERVLLFCYHCGKIEEFK